MSKWENGNIQNIVLEQYNYCCTANSNKKKG